MIDKLGLGTVQFGLDYGISNNSGITSSGEVKKILNLALESGITLLDTAHSYGNSEEVLGDTGIQDFDIVSKYMLGNNGEGFKIQISNTLDRLKTNHLYGLLAHRPLDVIKNPGQWDYLQEIKMKGVVEKIGFSFNTYAEANQVLNKGLMPDLIQVPFNYFDDRFKKLMTSLKETGCEVHARSPFLQGLFFVPPYSLPEFFDEVKSSLHKLQNYENQLPGLLLDYCIKQNFIDRVILGVNSFVQLQDNLRSIKNHDNLPKLNMDINHKILTPSKWPKK